MTLFTPVYFTHIAASQLAHSTSVSTSQILSRVEYLIRSDNIIVFAR